VIRTYVPADLDALLEVFRHAVRVSARRAYTESQVRAWAPDQLDRDRWAHRLVKLKVWVAEEGDTPLGFCAMESDGHVDVLYVHSASQRRGLATALLAEAEAFARAGGVARLYTEASITARPFFEHCGFRTLAAQKVHLRGEEFRNYKMEKVLRLDSAKAARPG
jgi:putative acetyltransferase